MAVELVGAVAGWLVAAGGNSAVRKARDALLGPPQLRALGRVVNAAVDQTVSDAGLADDQAAHLRSVLLERPTVPDTQSVSSEQELRSALGEWVRTLDEPGPNSERYLSGLGLEPGRIAEALASRILDGVAEDARRGGPLKDLATWIWRDRTTERLERIETTVQTLQSRGRVLLEQLHQQAMSSVRADLGHDGGQGSYRLDRTSQAAMLNAAATEASATIVYGESGTGKSALALEASTADPDVPALCLNLRHLPDNVASLTATLGAPLVEHLREAAPPGRLLVVDSADAVAQDRQDVLAHLVQSADASGMCVVAVTSNENRRVVHDVLREHTQGTIKEWHVEVLSDDEVQDIVDRFPQLARLARHPRSLDLLRRLVVVDLLVRGEITGPIPLSDWDAMQAVWAGLVRRHEIADRGSPEAREQVLIRLAAWEFAGRSPTALPQMDPEAVDWLRRDGVLRPANGNPWQSSPDFSHDEVRRYATARFLGSTGDAIATLQQVRPPRWALSAALLAAQGQLSWRNSDGLPPAGVLARVQAGFDTLAASGAGARWADVPTEALLGLGNPDAVLRDAWQQLTAGDQAGVDRLLRVLGQRHSREADTIDPVAADPVVNLLLDHPTPWTCRPASFDVLRRWLLGLVIRDTRAGHPLRQRLRERLLAFCTSADQGVAAQRQEGASPRARSTSAAIQPDEVEHAVGEPLGRHDRLGLSVEVRDKEVLELLALLGPDLGPEGERVVRLIATNDPWYLAPAIEEFGTGRALAGYSTELLAELSLAYYIENEGENDWHFDRDGVRDHRWRRPDSPLAAWYRGPFSALFGADPELGASVLNRLLNHAARVHGAIQMRFGGVLGRERGVAIAEDETVLHVTGSSAPYAGDAAVWCWYRGTTTGPYPCTSALQAMERVCDQLIQLGVPLERVVGMLLQECKNLATLGLVVGLLVRHLEKAGTLLDPFLVEPLVWEFEFARASHDLGSRTPVGDEVVGQERRAWSLREVAMHMVLAADSDRAAQLSLIGQRLVAAAEAMTAEDGETDGVDARKPAAPSYPAQVRAWASVLDRSNYRADIQDNLVYLEVEPPPDVAAALAPITQDLGRGQEVIRLQNRYFTNRKHRPADYSVPDVDELLADIDSVRGLLENPPRLLGIPPAEAAAHVCLAALEGVVRRGLTLPDEQIQFAANLVLQIAERRAPATEHEYEGTYFEQAVDRTAAKAVPLFLLPQAVSLHTACGEARIKQAGLNLAAALPNETRLFLARACDPVWQAPCHGSPCRHRVAFEWIIEAARDCTRGGWNSEEQEYTVITLADPIAPTLVASRAEDVNAARLDAAIRGCGAAATSASCIRADARALLDALLDSQRRALSSRRFGDRRGSHSLVSARALLGLASNGEQDPLEAHLDAYQTNAYMLGIMLDALTAAAAETTILGATAAQLWPSVIERVLAYRDNATNPFQTRTWGDYALAALIPRPALARTMLYSEAGPDLINWVDPLWWSDSVEEWLEVAKGRPKCVGSLVALVSNLPPGDQATLGLKWVSTLVGINTTEIVEHTSGSMLAEWLINLRGVAQSLGALPEWQRLVDVLAVAGDQDLAQYSQ